MPSTTRRHSLNFSRDRTGSALLPRREEPRRPSRRWATPPRKGCGVRRERANRGRDADEIERIGGGDGDLLRFAIGAANGAQCFHRFGERELFANHRITNRPARISPRASPRGRMGEQLAPGGDFGSRARRSRNTTRAAQIQTASDSTNLFFVRAGRLRAPGALVWGARLPKPRDRLDGRVLGRSSDPAASPPSPIGRRDEG